MKFQKLIKALIALATCNGVVFLLAGWLLYALIDQSRITTSRSNHLSQRLDYLLEYSKGQAPFKKESFTDQLVFFQSILRMNESSLDDIHGLLGFCYFNLGDRDKARISYEKAIRHNQNHFWYQHNLAVVYYLQGEYSLAAQYAKSALLNDESEGTNFTLPRLYLALLNHSPDYTGVAERISMAKYQAYAVFLLSLRHTQPQGAQGDSQVVVDAIHEHIRQNPLRLLIY